MKLSLLNRKVFSMKLSLLNRKFFPVKLSLLNRKFFSRWNCHSWIIKFSRWNCHSWIVRYFRWNCHSRIIRFSRWNCHSWIVRFSLPGELNNTVRIRTGEMRYNRKSYDSRETGTTNSVEEIGYDGYWYSNAIIRAVWFWIGLLRLGICFFAACFKVKSSEES